MNHLSITLLSFSRMMNYRFQKEVIVHGFWCCWRNMRLWRGL